MQKKCRYKQPILRIFVADEDVVTASDVGVQWNLSSWSGNWDDWNAEGGK